MSRFFFVFLNIVMVVLCLCGHSERLCGHFMSLQSHFAFHQCIVTSCYLLFVSVFGCFAFHECKFTFLCTCICFSFCVSSWLFFFFLYLIDFLTTNVNKQRLWPMGPCRSVQFFSAAPLFYVKPNRRNTALDYYSCKRATQITRLGLFSTLT